MEVKLVVQRGGKRQTFSVSPPVAVIGRARGNAVRIPSAEVSRQHCRLRMDEGMVTVEDLGSINGTFINGRRISRRESIRPGDELGVGPIHFKVDYTPSAAAQKQFDEPEDLVEAGFDDVLSGLADGSLVDQVDEFDEVELVLDGDVKEDDLPVMDGDDDFKPIPVPEEDKLRPDFTFNQPWQMPEAGDLQDILQQMEKDDRTPPPPSPKKKKKK